MVKKNMEGGRVVDRDHTSHSHQHDKNFLYKKERTEHRDSSADEDGSYDVIRRVPNKHKRAETRNSRRDEAGKHEQFMQRRPADYEDFLSHQPKYELPRYGVPEIEVAKSRSEDVFGTSWEKIRPSHIEDAIDSMVKKAKRAKTKDQVHEVQYAQYAIDVAIENNINQEELLHFRAQADRINQSLAQE